MVDEATREAFEAWMGQGIDLVRANPTSGTYRNDFVDGRWDAWQAATVAERERCAKVCDAQAARESYGHAKHAAGACADAIRKGDTP